MLSWPSWLRMPVCGSAVAPAWIDGRPAMRSSLSGVLGPLATLKHNFLSFLRISEREFVGLAEVGYGVRQGQLVTLPEAIRIGFQPETGLIDEVQIYGDLGPFWAEITRVKTPKIVAA